MALSRKDDPESRLYWESRERIAREAEQQRKSWVREEPQRDSPQRRDCETPTAEPRSPRR